MKIKFFLNGSFPVYPAFQAYQDHRAFQANPVFPVRLNFQVNQDHRRVRKHQQRPRHWRRERGKSMNPLRTDSGARWLVALAAGLLVLTLAAASL